MKQRVVMVAAVAACALLASLVYVELGTYAPRVDLDGTIEISSTTVRVSIVDTPSARERGLSGKSGLGADEGMLFVFPVDGEYGFWMKDMLFSIDILWISSGGTIVHVVERVSPDTYPTSFRSPTPARYVLELPAGYAKSHYIKIGDQVYF